MIYQLNDATVKTIANGLEEYYADAWADGVKGLFDKMARSNMGVVTGYIDIGKDSYSNLRKKKADSFKVTYKAKIKNEVRLYFGNRSDVASDLVTIGEKVLTTLASKIPVPVVGSIITALAGVGANAARDELHARSISEADKQIAAKSGAELSNFFVSDTNAIKFIEQTINQYKTVGKYAQTLPNQINSFDDAITYPTSVFKVQQAASSLNVAIWSIKDYLESMSERLLIVQKETAKYITSVKTTMPDAVKNVIQQAYADGVIKGKADITRNKYAAPPTPKPLVPPRPGEGPATQLAAYVSHAMSQGYYDSGNTGPQFGRR